MKTIHTIIAALAFILALPATSNAYSIGSDFGDPCHEQLALAVYLNLAIDLPTDTIALPASEGWRKLGDEFLKSTGVAVSDEAQKLVIVSLIIGVRSPDTNGHGLFDFDSLRALHAAPDGQYIHALRAIDDDGPDGDAVAVTGIRQEILASLSKVQEFAQLPPADQIIEVDLYLDFYGLIQIEVWAVPFFFGKAMHTLQDSFSHTIRSDDLRKIRHVMNYVDAIGNSFEEGTDGMAHSDSMDKCVGETAPVFNAAREATLELMLAANPTFNDQDTNTAVAAVLDKWVTHEPGCTLANNYCDSKWVPIARLEPTGPYLETILGCGALPVSGSPRGAGWFWGLMLALVALRVARRRS